MADRYFEDPSSVLKNVTYVVPAEEARMIEWEYEEREDDVRQRLLDTHVSRGAITRESCARWMPRLMENFDYTAEVLDDFEDDAEQGDRAYEDDPRIRAQERAYLDLLGIPQRTVEYESDDDLSAEERQARQFLSVIGR